MTRIEMDYNTIFSLIFASIHFRGFRDVARNAKIKTIFESLSLFSLKSRNQTLAKYGYVDFAKLSTRENL